MLLATIIPKIPPQEKHPHTGGFKKRAPGPPGEYEDMSTKQNTSTVQRTLSTAGGHQTCQTCPEALLHLLWPALKAFVQLRSDHPIRSIPSLLLDPAPARLHDQSSDPGEHVLSTQTRAGNLLVFVAVHLLVMHQLKVDCWLDSFRIQRHTKHHRCA